MKTLIRITAAVTVLFVATVIAQAGGACAGCTGVPVWGAGGPIAAVNVVATDSLFGWAGDHTAVHGPHPLQANGRRYPYPSVGTAALGGSLVPFVPGTLGQTYQRRTHAIPEDKHPRTAMLAVRDRSAVDHLSVQRMNGFRMSDGVWLYETNRPLTSLTENIVRVEARHEVEDVEPHKTMFVRLIPGRIVYLDFE